VIAIEFQSVDPELAARVTNAVAETYLTLQQVAKQDQARSAGQWLSGELDKLRTKVSEAEEKVGQFRAKSNLFVGANNTSLSNQQLTEVNSQLSAAQAQQADAETRARLIRQQLLSGQPIESSDITNSELIRRLSEQRVTLRAQLAEQSSTLLPQHPRIKELRAQIADLDRQIRMEGEGLARSLENDSKVANARVEMLTADLDRLKRRAASTSDQDVQLRALEREAKAQRDLFESYLAKYREASAQDSIAAAPADARIISRAVVSNVPYFPKKGPIIVIAALAMFCLSTAFVATSSLLGSDGFPTSVSQLATAPPSAAPPGDGWPALPAPAAAAAASVAQASAPDAGARIGAIAASLRDAGEGGRRVAVMGSGHEVGTTLTAIALARSLARDARVVLVDLAFSAPNIDVISVEPAAPGIADLVRGTASFGDIITRDRLSRAHLVAAGSVRGDVEAMLCSQMLISAVDALSQSFDHLVLDVGAQSDITPDLLAPLASRVVLVAGVASENTTGLLGQLLTAAGFEAVVVFNGQPPGLDHAAVQTAAA
jgi:Mrp family chromosome partitioning ATPase